MKHLSRGNSAWMRAAACLLAVLLLVSAIPESASAAKKLTIDFKLEVTNATIGETMVFPFQVSGGSGKYTTVSYQLDLGTKGKFTTVKKGAPNKNSAEIAYKPTQGDQLRMKVVAKDSKGATASKTVVVSILNPLVILSEPKNGKVGKLGEVATTKVKARGEGLTYTWYYGNLGDKKFTKSTIKTPTYSVKITSKTNGQRVYCVVKDSYGSVQPTETVVMSLADPAVITKQPQSVKVAKAGEKAKATVKAKGDGLTYLWYCRAPGETKYAKTTVQTAAYSAKVTKKNSGMKLICVVKDKYGNKVKSTPISFSIAKPVSITAQPTQTLVNLGENAVVTVKAKGDGLTYQWYIKQLDHAGFEQIGQNKAKLTVKMTEKRDRALVYCVVTDQYGYKATSSMAVIGLLNPKVPLEYE